MRPRQLTASFQSEIARIGVNLSSVLDKSSEAPRTSVQLTALEKLFSRIGELTAPPAIAVQIINVTSDDSASTDELLNAVENDPALATRIVRVVNSGFYSVRNRVSDLRTAVTMLGFTQVRNLALTGYTARMFKSDGAAYRTFTREGLWKHLVAVASTSRLVAQECGYESPDEAYLAGLMHDVGLVLIDQHLHRHFKLILEQIDPSTETTAAERNRLPFDHTELGEFVVRQWDFPPQIAAAARLSWGALKPATDGRVKTDR